MSLPIYNQDLGIIGILAQSAPQEYTDCITFTGETSDFTLRAQYKEWNGTVEYSTDHNTWKVWNGGEISSVSGKLYLRGSGNTTFRTSYGARFVLSAKAACSGNIQTLLQYNNPPSDIPAKYCYWSMFDSCTNLTAAPALPATTLKSYCYQYMFFGCTSLTTAPELPATTLTTYCYAYMFSGCTSLKVSSIKTGAYQYAWRIPTSGTISSEPTSWNLKMLTNTGGTFTSDPSINTTYYIENEPV